jgi:hypothetical protein
MEPFVTPGNCKVSLNDLALVEHSCDKGKMLMLDMIDPDDLRHVEVYLSDENLKELAMQLIDYLGWEIG